MEKFLKNVYLFIYSFSITEKITDKTLYINKISSKNANQC